MAADTGFVAELSLYGKFFQMNKHQFFRRFHADSSSWKRGNREQEARRFHAANVRRLPFNIWRYNWTFVRSILRSPLGSTDRLKLLRRVGKAVYWDRSILTHELLQDLPSLLSPTTKEK